MGKRILLIDDDDLVRTTIQSILESAGYEVIQAADGEQGVDVYRTHAPDLVITDILMPNKEGIETIRDLKRCDPAPRVIAISGGDRNGNVQFLQMAEKLGADRILAKPFRKAALLEMVDALLSDGPSAD
jgi:DNA-binding response OmpR family regulator